MRAFVSMFVILIAFSPRIHGQSVNATYSFEASMEGWEMDSVAYALKTCGSLWVPGIYPECRFLTNASSVDGLVAVRRTGELAFDGTHALKITIDGSDGGATAWIARSFSVAPGVRYRVELSYYISPPGGGA